MKLPEVIKMLREVESTRRKTRPDKPPIVLDYDANGDLKPMCQLDTDCHRVYPFASELGGTYTVAYLADWLDSLLLNMPRMAEYDFFAHDVDGSLQPANWYMVTDYKGHPAIAFQVAVISAVEEGPQERQMEYDK